MKKLFLMLMLAVISLGTFAQTRQGGQQVGFNIGYALDRKSTRIKTVPNS